MDGILWTTLGAVIGLAAPFLYIRWRRSDADEPPAFSAVPSRPASRPAAPSNAKRQPPRGYHGVSLKPCKNACDAVQTIIGQRFLSSEAPALPLAGCDRQQCKCTYGHYSDRRDKEDRRTGWGTFGGFVPSLSEGNRRDKGRDRRG
jgi:hypothetical protein